MGQAKARGSFEERRDRAIAIERERIEAEEIQAQIQREAARQQRAQQKAGLDRDPVQSRRGQPLTSRSRILMAAALTAAAMSTLR